MLSEQRIDGITKGIEDIKHLLQGLNVSSEGKQSETASSAWNFPQAGLVKHLAEPQPVTAPGGEPPSWDHSIQIVEFVRSVVEDRGSSYVGSAPSEVISSLKSLLQALETPTAARHLSISGAKVAKHHTSPTMPPVEAVVAVLRWAKGLLISTKYISYLL